MLKLSLPIALALFVGWVFWYVRRGGVDAREENRKYWWWRRRQDRNDLVEAAMREVMRGHFRSRRSQEDLWAYAEAMRRHVEGTLDVSPQGPLWHAPYTKDRRAVKPTRRQRLVRRLQQPWIQGQRYFTGWHQEVPALQPHVGWTVVTTFWWSTKQSGVVHRVAKLTHDQMQTPVLACDTDVRIPDDEIKEHVSGKGPLVNCLRCALFVPL